MSKKKMVDTKYWTDTFVLTLTPNEKLLFLYFLTNDKATLCGIYECPVPLISFETKVDEQDIWKAFEKFEGKVHYLDGWIYVRNMARYHADNEKIQIGIENEKKKVPAKILKKVDEIDSMYASESLFGDGFNPDPKASKAAIKEQVNQLLEYYRLKIKQGTNISDQSFEKIQARLKDKPVNKAMTRFDELKLAIDKFSKDEWRMKNNRDNGLQFFFRSEDQIIKWLELETRESDSPKVHKYEKK